jgi:hypothetical protein
VTWRLPPHTVLLPHIGELNLHPANPR